MDDQRGDDPFENSPEPGIWRAPGGDDVRPPQPTFEQGSTGFIPPPTAQQPPASGSGSPPGGSATPPSPEPVAAPPVPPGYAAPPGPAAPPPGASYPAPPAPAYRRPTKTWMNVVSFIAAFAGFCIPGATIAGIVFGHLGVNAANKGEADQKGLGIAGLVLNYLFTLGFVLYLVFVFFYAVSCSSDPYGYGC